jgi:hypothetical protein
MESEFSFSILNIFIYFPLTDTVDHLFPSALLPVFAKGLSLKELMGVLFQILV